MRKLTPFLLVVATLILASRSKSQQPAIVGRWHEVGTTALAAFHEDGTVELTDGRTEVSGRYTIFAPGKLKIELSGKGASVGPRVYRFTLSGDKMVWTDVDDQKTEYLKAQ